MVAVPQRKEEFNTQIRHRWTKEHILEAQRFHFNKGCLIDFLTLLLINAPFQKSVNE